VSCSAGGRVVRLGGRGVHAGHGRCSCLAPRKRLPTWYAPATTRRPTGRSSILNPGGGRGRTFVIDVTVRFRFLGASSSCSSANVTPIESSGSTSKCSTTKLRSTEYAKTHKIACVRPCRRCLDVRDPRPGTLGSTADRALRGAREAIDGGRGVQQYNAQRTARRRARATARCAEDVNFVVGLQLDSMVEGETGDPVAETAR
jgi:hypothetical protein